MAGESSKGTLDTWLDEELQVEFFSNRGATGHNLRQPWRLVEVAEQPVEANREAAQALCQCDCACK